MTYRSLSNYAYLSEEIFQKEKKLFKNAPKYIGNKLQVSDVHDYHTTEHEFNKRILINSPNGINVVSNICQHRQAKMLEGRGKIENIICPLHNWKYDLNGKILNAPFFENNICSNLDQTNFWEWNHLLFENQNDFLDDVIDFPYKDYIDFSEYNYESNHTYIANYNWKTFIETYQDNYHVKPYHPGLGNFVNCDQIEWFSKKSFNGQSVGIQQNFNYTTENFKNWILELKKEYIELPRYAAIWMNIFPNITIEWYPKTLIITVVEPISAQQTKVYTEFYYHNDVFHFNKNFIIYQQASYYETGDEDDKMAEKIDQGRKILFDDGIEQVGPFHHFYEKGILDFHKYLSDRVDY